MQTFLPYSNFKKTFKCLDYAGSGIYINKGFVNHPIEYILQR